MVWSGLAVWQLMLQFPELGGGMASHSMQGHFSAGPAPHSPAGPPGLMVAGPMPHPDYMHPAMGAGGQYIPIPMQVTLTSHVPCAQQCLTKSSLCASNPCKSQGAPAVSICSTVSCASANIMP